MFNSDTIIALCEQHLIIPNNSKRDYYRKHIRKHPDHLETQLSYLYAKSLLSQPTSNKEIDRDTTLIDENKSLKEENESLKEQLQLKTNMYESLKSGNKHLKQQIKNSNKEYEQKIRNLQSDIDKYKKQINNIKTGGLTKLVTHDDDIRIPPGQDKLLTYKDFINKGIPVMDISDSDSDYEMDSDYGSDPENELNKGLH